MENLSGFRAKLPETIHSVALRFGVKDMSPFASKSIANEILSNMDQADYVKQLEEDLMAWSQKCTELQAKLDLKPSGGVIHSPASAPFMVHQQIADYCADPPSLVHKSLLKLPDPPPKTGAIAKFVYDASQTLYLYGPGGNLVKMGEPKPNVIFPDPEFELAFAFSPEADGKYEMVEAALEKLPAVEIQGSLENYISYSKGDALLSKILAKPPFAPFYPPDIPDFDLQDLKNSMIGGYVPKVTITDEAAQIYDEWKKLAAVSEFDALNEETIEDVVKQEIEHLGMAKFMEKYTGTAKPQSGIKLPDPHLSMLSSLNAQLAGKSQPNAYLHAQQSSGMQVKAKAQLDSVLLAGPQPKAQAAMEEIISKLYTQLKYQATAQGGQLVGTPQITTLKQVDPFAYVVTASSGLALSPSPHGHSISPEVASNHTHFIDTINSKSYGSYGNGD